jgi:hypothetical protein
MLRVPFVTSRWKKVVRHLTFSGIDSSGDVSAVTPGRVSFPFTRQPYRSVRTAFIPKLPDADRDQHQELEME